MKSLKRYKFLIPLALLFCYLALAVAPYLVPGEVSPEFQNTYALEDYLGREPGSQRVRLIESAQEGLRGRMLLFQEAQTSLDISYYAVHGGSSTDTVLGGILEAADRGVQVRLLLDGMFGKLSREDAAALTAHPNITLKYYNPTNLLKPQALNARLHDKYILVDDKFLLLGGTNLGDQYLSPPGYDGPVSYDREVLVYETQRETPAQNSVLSQVRAYLDGLWNGDWVRECHYDLNDKGEGRQALLREASHAYYSRHPELLKRNWDYEAITHPAAQITLLTGDTAPARKSPELGYLLSRLALDAKRSVYMQSPYVILDKNLRAFLEELDRSGLDCEILTNSVASSPNPIARSVYSHDRKAIAKSGIRLMEYQGPGSIHAKTYVIDERLVLLGSFNLDPRSAYIDTELMLAVDSPALAREVLEARREYRDQSLEVAPGGGYGENLWVAPRPVGVGNRLVTALLSLPARLFRSLV